MTAPSRYARIVTVSLVSFLAGCADTTLDPIQARPPDAAADGRIVGNPDLWSDGGSTANQQACAVDFSARATLYDPQPVPDPCDGTPVDVVEAGADPTGKEPINAVVEAETRDGVVLTFPEGRYRVRGSLAAKASDFCMRAAGGAELVSEGDLATLILNGSNVGYRGFVHRFVDGRGLRLRAVAPRGLVVRDIRVEGRSGQDRALFHVVITEPDGKGWLLDVKAVDGSDDATTETTAIFVSKSHAGTLIVRDAVVGRFSQFGLNQNRESTGRVRIEGGRFADNELAHLRLVGDDSGVIGTEMRFGELHRDLEGTRAVWLRDGQDYEVRYARVQIGDVSGLAGIAMGAGRTHVSDTLLWVDGSMPAIFGGSTDRRPNGLVARNVIIGGEASGGSAIRLVDRADSVLERICVRQTGADRDGIVLEGAASDATVRDSEIDVTGEPIVR